MPPDQPVNPAGEPSPGRPEDPAAAGTTFTPGVLRAPASRVRIRTTLTPGASGEPAAPVRIGRGPKNDVIVAELGVSKEHAELRRTPDGRYWIFDLGSHNGTYVNGTRVSQQELSEGDIITIGHHASLRLAGGELIEHVDDVADGKRLAGMIATRLEQWLEREGVDVPGAGRVELAGEIGWEPGSGTLYLRRLDDGKVWRVDVPVTVRAATPEEVRTPLQRERDLAAELRGQLEAREHRIESLQAELRALAAGNPAVLPVLDRLGIRPAPEA